MPFSKINLFILLLAGSFLIGWSANAHEPRYVKDDQLVIIKNPEVSQAFYGELKGSLAYYLIYLPEAQNLYLQILVPALPDIAKDKSVVVEYLPQLGQPGLAFASLDPQSVVWKNFHEEYAGDDYWQGPEINQPAEAGYYLVKVSSPENLGKYVLVVGQKEEFPVLEMAKAVVTIPQLKTKFFNKPLWRSFEGKVGEYGGGGILVFLIFCYLFYKFHRVYK